MSATTEVFYVPQEEAFLIHSSFVVIWKSLSGPVNHGRSPFVFCWQGIHSAAAYVVTKVDVVERSPRHLIVAVKSDKGCFVAVQFKSQRQTSHMWHWYIWETLLSNATYSEDIEPRLAACSQRQCVKFGSLAHSVSKFWGCRYVSCGTSKSVPPVLQCKGRVKSKSGGDWRGLNLHRKVMTMWWYCMWSVWRSHMTYLLLTWQQSHSHAKHPGPRSHHSQVYC